MKMLYFIKTDDGWKQVSHDEYRSFNGTKETRPSTWLLNMFNDMFVSLRWSR